jgi:hypothetical protein
MTPDPYLFLVVEPPSIEHIEYIADTVNPALIQQENKEGENEEKEKAKEEGKKRDEKPPIGVSMKLPGDVVFNEEPQLGRWDYEQNVWRMDGFTDLTYNEGKSLDVKFSGLWHQLYGLACLFYVIFGSKLTMS